MPEMGRARREMPRGPSLFEIALSSAENEPDADARTRLVLAAVRELLGRDDDSELARNRITVEARLIEAAASAPDTALRLLCDVADRCGIDAEAGRGVLGVWMRRPVAAEFARTWFSVGGLLTDNADLAAWVANSIMAGSDEVSDEFRRLARAHLTAVVDKDFERYQFSGQSSPVWHVLYALGPASRPDWFLKLGDLAAERGEEDEAARRYELAERFGGGAQARERVRRLHDIGAYHRLARGVTTADKLKGPGTPSAYRQLVVGAAAVMDGKSPQLTEVLRAREDRLRPSALLLTALDRLRSGNPDGAREQLRLVLNDPTGDALSANAQLVLGALDENDELITEGARTLLARHGRGWPARSLVDATTVLTAVSHCEPALVSDLIGATGNDPNGELRELRITVASTVLAKAARAELFSHPEETDAALARAQQLLDGVDGEDATRLRAAATRISEIAANRRAADNPDRPLDRLAYAELRRDGELQPWTPSALRLWQECDAEIAADSRSLHHLAIAEHARAYQLEIEGDAGAFEQWRRALGVWARVHADDGFWAGLGAHLAAVTSDMSAEDIARTVENARAELPGQLLEPHVTRVQELRKDQLPRARAHLELIRTAAFSPADLARARARLAREAGAQIRRLIREGELDRALDEARAWVEIDADNIPLAEQALDVGIETVETAHRRGDGWAEQARSVLERVSLVVEPMCTELGLTAKKLTTGARPTFDDPDRAAFAAKYARHEFWFGVSLVVSTIDRLQSNPFDDRNGFRIGANHLNTALTLGLPAHAPYNKARDMLVGAGQWARYSQGHVVGFF